MSILLLDEDTIMLDKADFPDFFIDNHHPDDYILGKTPTIELFLHKKYNHNRLILRMSFQLTFICDTGAPDFFYFNTISKTLLKDRVLEDEIGMQYILIDGRKFPMKDSPDTNIIGLAALLIFGLELKSDRFGFTNLPEFF